MDGWVVMRTDFSLRSHDSMLFFLFFFAFAVSSLPSKSVWGLYACIRFYSFLPTDH